MAQRAVGTTLMIGTITVGGITSISGLELSADTIDTTTLDSDGGYREFIGGFKDGGEVGISGFFMPDNAGQAAIYQAFKSGATSACKIVFPPEMETSWEFNAVVTGFSTGAELEDALSFEGTLKVSGEPTLVLP
ncbi:hypothetical protein PA598K_01496 [Paenibacillus sp. 598K]|uniref:phage tail tube protein n=1 Tax=Paenibacillus sp. 598K TaxID=1117987 RepID=UPI000FFAC82F|nr:phage tail tube protein [Paenibacillus sp. 598K]GBF73211.1 hypothetical protein PA598K_01496 [Paenibacillus sp. 598K]